MTFSTRNCFKRCRNFRFSFLGSPVGCSCLTRKMYLLIECRPTSVCTFYFPRCSGFHPSLLTIPSVYLSISIHDHRTSSFSSDDSLYIYRYIYPRPQDFILLL